MDFLVGVKEVGEILGWDRRKVSTYQLRGVLPKPVVQLYSGPIWFRKQIEFYKAGKDFGVRTYYIKGERVYECTHNQPFKDTIYSPNDLKEKKGDFILYQEQDVQQLKNAILEKKPIVQFLSFESISFLHDLGILETVVFQDYIQQCSLDYIEERGGKE
ncbi:hypothetical protein MPH61_23455 [Peribacillus muralis]|uniref:hypothetical protein n=1 Tax=Peribacillus muralis TaxID=264697 RepID=UPI001F4E3C92|nr:hypothetical protein [Peribacillus muralis]MCK1995483.1 hypothetical protein [Peribacillus muralis]MCK2016066.1 hypothetical protein [Peribacillus muralis]